jgi:hydroxymethylglutaryl-CoA lyase
VIPNLRDAEEVCARIQRRQGIKYRALVPNARGAERAGESKLDELL